MAVAGTIGQFVARPAFLRLIAPFMPPADRKLKSERSSFRAKWFLLALLTGLAAGGAAVLFHFLIEQIQTWTLNDLAGFLPDSDAAAEASVPKQWFTSVWAILPIITLGGLVTGLLVYFLAPETQGSGADAAIDAFHNKRGMIPARVPLVKLVASAVTLGTGGSAGREGPMSYITAGIGSFIGQRFKLSTHDRRILMAIGMGAGVGAVFRAPMAGAIFAGEILYRDADIESEVIIPGALASVVAYSIFQFSLPQEQWFTPLFGNQVAYEMTNVAELLPYTALALLLVVFAVFYVHLFRIVESLFQRLPAPAFLKPSMGALSAGLLAIGAFFAVGGDPQVLATLGSGYDFLKSAMSGADSLGFVVLFTVAIIKVLTTSLTVGSGGSGGVFGPSMVIGGCVGAGLGKVCQQWLPGFSGESGAFAVVGMAGFFAGVANAPFSTILMVAEITGSYRLLLPTLWVCSICFILCRDVSLYSKQVGSRLESPAHLGDFTVDLLAGILVQDVYRKKKAGIVFHEQNTLDEIVHALAKSRQRYFYVYNSDEELVGIFSAEDVRRFLYDDTMWKFAIAIDIMTERVVTLRLDDDLNHAFGQFTALNVDELPVVSPENANEILGVLRRKETIAIYNQRRLELEKQKLEENQ